MLFTSEGSQLLEVTEQGDEVKYVWGQDLSEHLNMCYQLRTYDENNGISNEGHFQHVASLDDITYGMLLTTKPEVLRDSKALHKWLTQDPMGQRCRVSRDATPIKGDGLQIMTRPGYRYK